MVFDHKNESANHHTSDKFVDAKAVAAHDTDIEAWRAGTLRTLDLISEGDILALKTTGGGPTVSMAFSRGELPPQQMLDALDEIATKCKERNVQIIVDAESQHWQKGIARTSLELMRKFNHDGKAVIYNTYQAYLKDTSDVLAYHMAEAERDGFTLGLKLVRGAYILSDNRSLIHDTKEDTDNAYNTIAQGALRQQIGIFGASGPSARPFPSVNLFLASHNRESVLSAHRLYRQRLEAGLPTVPVAYGQLHGMSDEVSFSLLAEKSDSGKAPEVLKCTTWGSMEKWGPVSLPRTITQVEIQTFGGSSNKVLLTLSLLTQELWSYEEVVHLDPLQALKFSFPELWQEAPKISAHYEVTMLDLTLCILGCGNLGTPILQSLINAPPNSLRGITQFVACVQSESSEKRLQDLFSQHQNVRILRKDNVTAIKTSEVIILGVDPSQVEATLQEEGVKEALQGKLLISIVAGWPRSALESLVGADPEAKDDGKKTWVLRTLPNVAALVYQSLTAIEHHPSPSFPAQYSALATAIFSQIGKSLPIPPSLMPATTAVSGSTPAFWAIIVDSLIDAAVAVGVPRKIAQDQIYQSMRGSAEMLQSGIQPGELRDMGTSPEGCTIAGVMVLEEGGVRGVLGRALRESVTVARAMGKVGEGEEVHVNDTRKI
ncbi:hypothetical protein AA0117_g7467 [Alternaria alternata]|uniref:Proline dehydrogenase n=1 Tax=Alternaria alternata TaxID=5599 RepID=A0A4Q4NC22_ALTAL|nr:hypothetical protein AA0117_g7467 [Alternaria alternata]